MYRLGKQRLRAYLKRSKILVIEVLIVGIAEVGAEQRQILVAYHYRLASRQQLLQTSLLRQSACILQCLVIVSESSNHHTVQTIGILDSEVEVAHHIMGEIYLRHLVQQFILVDRIRHISKHKHKLRIALGIESLCIYRVAISKHRRTSSPHIAKVEACAMQRFASIHSIHYHARHFSQLALWEFLYHSLHIVHTALAVAIVELCQSAYKQEFISILA